VIRFIKLLIEEAGVRNAFLVVFMSTRCLSGHELCTFSKCKFTIL